MTWGRFFCAARSTFDGDALTSAPLTSIKTNPIKLKLAAPFDIRARALLQYSSVAHRGPLRQPLGWRENLPYNAIMKGQFHDWRGATAPTLSDIDALAAEAFARLPDQFRALCENLVIRVEDFPSEELLDRMGLESEFDLLGLFQGVGVPFQSETAPQVMPNMIWLYRRPILDHWAEHGDSLGEIVAHVLVHEIGHHFGLSDEDIEAIENSID